jgi:adenine-specific DNA-methyltransferase
MKLTTQSPKKALKAFLKQKPLRSDIDLFKTNLIALLNKINVDKINAAAKKNKPETEEHLKNDLRDFLRDTFYRDTNAINTKDRKDLVIHLGKTTDTEVGIILEAKRPANISEMISPENANKKALHELILYYLDERTQADNHQLKHLVITNVQEWYIFDANFFDKHIYRNTKIKNLYDTKRNDKKDNPWFYEEIAKILAKLETEFPCIFFDIREYDTILRNDNKEDDRELSALFKILSPQHLLKIASPNDSNSLNEKFYKELLHLIGLEEAKEGGKNIIRRKIQHRHAASLIEATIDAITTEEVLHRVPDLAIYGENKADQTFNVALELCITWVNRILFLKLLEGQLIAYHQGNNDFRFLNTETIHDFDELFKLFHKVLAVNTHARSPAIKAKYHRVPYLNSSLFDISELEDQTIKINSLDNGELLELIGTSILKDTKKNTSALPTLSYLFQFLDAYDFASEGTAEVQEDNKTLINASVLGKVFEKINGYKDGSIFTPAFITMYMCRQSIRLAVVEKFNEALAEKGSPMFDSFEDVKNYTARMFKTHDIRRANDIVNFLRICDPAVGSGHFLVSSLNEIIAIKAELGILADPHGNCIAGYEIEIVNDELIITDQKGNILEYRIAYGKPLNKEMQLLQKTLFHEKQTIIENCLFGVDINPNSVKICRLRLWIELLKNAYYKESTNFAELETLPNIDINIKCGNSLLSRFALDADLSKVLKSIKYDMNAYRGFVRDYKNEKNREVKRGLQLLIDTIKSDFRTEIGKNDPKKLKLSKLGGELYNMTQQIQVFAPTPKEEKIRKDKQAKLETEINLLAQEIENIKNNTIYKNAFEWRFEFPEVLDNDGAFVGFDVVIGNPPYGAEISNRDILKDLYPTTSIGQIDTYKYFIELSTKIVKQYGIVSYITSDSYLEKKYFKDVRCLLISNSSKIRNIKLGDDIFEGINLPTAIFQIQKGNSVIQYEYKDISKTVDNVKKSNELNFEIDFENSIPEYENGFSVKKSILKNINTKALIDIYDQVMGVKVYQIGKGKPKQTSYEIENDIFITKEKVNSNYYKFISQGIERYNYKSKGEWINYGDWLAEPRNLKYFANPKVIIREIVNPRIFAAYIEEEAVVKNIAAVIIEKDKAFSLKYLIALLNSTTFTYYLFEQTPKSSNKTYPSFTSDIIKNIPIKIISPAAQLPFITLVEAILQAKQSGASSELLEKEIDELVYGLYGITDAERAMIEGK